VPAPEGKLTTSESMRPKNDVGAAGRLRHLAGTLSHRQRFRHHIEEVHYAPVYHGND
jgi:hypothetical protein